MSGTVSTVSFTITNPPSLNKLWAHVTHVPGKGRVRSKEYNAWVSLAGWELKIQMVGIPMICCRYNMELHVPISRRDTGNWEKAISDACQKVGVVSNDGNVHELRVVPSERSNCLVKLTLLPSMGGIRSQAVLRSRR